jgi:muramoyltetrapeptide carboxypeptidase
MEFSHNPGMLAYRKGRVEGRIVGGNLGTLLLLAATPYWPSIKGKILFIEDDEAENTQTIDRYFTQLRQMGIYNQINGMVIGRFPRCVGFNESDSLIMILDNALKGYVFPVLTDFDMGHTDPLMTIPLGAKVVIDANKKTITLLEAASK